MLQQINVFEFSVQVFSGFLSFLIVGEKDSGGNIGGDHCDESADRSADAHWKENIGSKS